jgi:hypothetical protein
MQACACSSSAVAAFEEAQDDTLIRNASFRGSQKIFFVIKRFDHLNTVAHNVIHRNCAQAGFRLSRVEESFFRRQADAG